MATTWGLTVLLNGINIILRYKIKDEIVNSEKLSKAIYIRHNSTKNHNLLQKTKTSKPRRGSTNRDSLLHRRGAMNKDSLLHRRGAENLGSLLKKCAMNKDSLLHRRGAENPGSPLRNL